MRQLVKFWHSFSNLAIVLKVWSTLQVVAPLVVATWAAVTGFAEDLPQAYIIAATLLALAGSLLCVSQFKQLLDVPVVVRNDHVLDY